jgi:hypothetical protein
MKTWFQSLLLSNSTCNRYNSDKFHLYMCWGVFHAYIFFYIIVVGGGCTAVECSC